MVPRKRRHASFLAVLSGSMLMAGHFSGASRWRDVIGWISDFIEVSPILRLTFLAIISISSLGGAAVILGGLLIFENRTLLGRLLILLGTGFGVVSFLLVLGLLAFRGNLPVAGSSLFVLIGIGLSIVARVRAKV